MIKNAANRLQQQPRRVVDRQQQQSSGSSEFQPQMPQFDSQSTSTPRRQHAGHETGSERRNNHGY